MKLLVFLVLFLFYLGVAEAAEKKYLNVGADPVEKDFCRKHKLQTFSLPEDVFVATTAKSRKVSVGWLHKDEEIGWVNKEYVICACGNSVKFLQIPEEKKSSTIAPENASAKKEEVKEEKEEVVIETTYYEPYYANNKLVYFLESGYGRYYGGGYYYGGGHRYYRHHYRHYRHHHHHRH